MSREKHLFFITSTFHYLVCKSIILENQLNNKDCYFVCGRGTSIEQGMQTFPLPMGVRGNVVNRFKFYLRYPQLVHSFFGDSYVIAYLPFSYLFPRQSYVNEIVFYEEGFSAYRRTFPKLRNTIKRTFGEFILKQLMRFVKEDVRGYLLLYDKMTDAPTQRTKLYVCSPTSYTHYGYVFEKKIVDISKVSLNEIDTTIKNGSFFVVLDRISSHGRPYQLDNYLKCLHEIIRFCSSHGKHEIWSRLHPADWDFESAQLFIESCFNEEGIKINWYKGGTEMLAKQDKSITFIGTNSTTLYYAPLLGATNKSYSFSKYLASIDPAYKVFLGIWGGVDEFVDIFSKNVNCLD